MRTAAASTSSSLLALGLLLAAPWATITRAAESPLRVPREGDGGMQQGPLPLPMLYAHAVQGKSTYYGSYVGGGSCGLDQPDGSAIPEEIQGIDWTVALDREQFFQGGCGMCIELHGTGSGSGGSPVKGVYRVFVNNLCPECEYGHLDVAQPGDGLWDITWKAVPCDVGDNTMRWVFMGSNDYYLKVSAQGARFPTKRLRLKLDGQQWVDGTPVHGSYFEFREGAPFRFPVEVEVTSIVDEVLTDWIQSIEGGPSKIQYRREPTDEELEEAKPGEEPETDDDIEEPSDSASAAPSSLPPLHAREAPRPSKAKQPAYDTLGFVGEVDGGDRRRRPFMGAEAEDGGMDDEMVRWDTQYLRGRVPRSG